MFFCAETLNRVLINNSKKANFWLDIFYKDKGLLTNKPPNKTKCKKQNRTILYNVKFVNSHKFMLKRYTKREIPAQTAQYF
jgi:hypothetical protein